MTTDALAALYVNGPHGPETWYQKVDAVLTDAECEQLIAATSLRLQREVNGPPKLSVAQLDPRECLWLFTRVLNVVDGANRWEFDLDGFLSLQVLSYGPGDEFRWHCDLASLLTPKTLKLAASVLLTRPDDFEGGELELMLGLKNHGTAGPSFVVPLERRGQGILFPAFAVHRVRPVTKGQRAVLVARIGGDAFL